MTKQQRMHIAWCSDPNCQDDAHQTPKPDETVTVIVRGENPLPWGLQRRGRSIVRESR